MMSHIQRLSRHGIFTRYQILAVRQLSMGSTKQQQAYMEFVDAAPERVDEEWLVAKPFAQIPGPSTWRMISHFLPGGKLYNTNLIEMNQRMRQWYGDIYCLPGMMGKPNMVFTYNPADFEVTYRNEGAWPIRIGLESFAYYRTVARPEKFGGIGGLVSEQGKSWGDIRKKVNPVLMKVQNVRQCLPQVDQITQEFIDKLETLRHPQTHTVQENFHGLIKKWTFEAIASVALNTRTGLFTDTPDPNAARLAKHMSEFFDGSFKYDIQPSIWPFYQMPGFKKFLKTYDNITDITTKYIENAIEKFEAQPDSESKCLLEQLLRLDKKIAIVMTIDMLMAGIDTTSSAFITILYHLASNPAKQEQLRKELCSILPAADAPLTAENTISLPYLRACIKEGLRITSITPGNFRITTKDLVLSGYRIPKGTGVLMGVLALSNDEQYFPRSADFLPERWLKSGPQACPEARSRNPFVYLPFGFGPRTCIGKRIAELEIETLLIRLLRQYKVTWLGKQQLQYESNIILSPSGDIQFKFEPLS